MKACVLAVVLGTVVLGLHMHATAAGETLPAAALLWTGTPWPSALPCTGEQPGPFVLFGLSFGLAPQAIR
jgi:hypothetical protein